MSNYQTLSVLTLIRGRQSHFDHLVAGLRAQHCQPDELVVAHMQPDPPKCPNDLPFAVRFVEVKGENLPLARARNAAAKTAIGAVLAFLDVDCIPDRSFVQRAREASSEKADGVFLPEVRYLPATDTGWLCGELPDYEKLSRTAERHPAKPSLAGHAIETIDDYGELWGLSFILQRDAWNAAGGMDENYVGYGGEETDFAERLRESGAHLFWMGGTICYHQHHTIYRPPLQHFDAIICNARRFRERWDKWCMDYWLDDFERRGLVKRSAEELKVLRIPTSAEIAAAKQPPHVRFS